MPRAADLGIRIGTAAAPARPTRCSTCRASASATRRSGATSPTRRTGAGVARTGVTVLDPGGDLFAPARSRRAARCSTAPASAPASSPVGEWGSAETPVFLTSTMQVGRVYDAACELLMPRSSRRSASRTSSSRWSVSATTRASTTPAGCRSTDDDVRAAWQAARAPRSGSPRRPTRAPSGAGTGMSCLGFKGGIGTASRVLPDGHTVGVLVLTNFGERDRLTVAGVPVGRLLAAPARSTRPLAAAGRVVHRRRRHRRAGRRRRLRAAGPRVGLGLARTGCMPTTAAARSSWPCAPACGLGRDDRTCGHTRSSRPRPRPALRRGRRGQPRRRCSTRCSPPRRSSGATGNTVDAASRSTRSSQLLRGTRTGEPRRPASRRGPDPDGRRHPAGRHALPARRRRRPAAVHPRGAAVPQGRPHRVVPPGVRPAARRARLRGLPARRARHGLVGRRRDRRVPAAGAAATCRGHRLAGRAGLVRRQRRHVRHVVLAASTRCRWRASGRRRSRRSSRSTPPTTATPTTCTTAAASLQVLDLVDYCHYMTPMNALPPVPALWGDGWRDEWLRADRDARAVAADLAATSSTTAPYWRHGSVRPTTTASRARR